MSQLISIYDYPNFKFKDGLTHPTRDNSIINELMFGSAAIASILTRVIVSEQWKDSSEAHILIGGAWHNVTEFYTVVSNQWKSNNG